MSRLSEYILYTPEALRVNAEAAILGRALGMRAHTIAGPYSHVMRNAHTVYLLGFYAVQRDLGETNRLAQLELRLVKNALMCDVTTWQWYRRHAADELFSPLQASAFPALHPRSAVLGVSGLSTLVHTRGKLHLALLFERARETLKL